MRDYLNLLHKVLLDGVDIPTRNGFRRTLYGLSFRHDLRTGFPAVTTKRLAFKQVTAELCWFLSGSTDLNMLHAWKTHIWDSNADDNGEVGPIYGRQWRNFNGDGVDQIANLIHRIKADPTSTRHMVTAWNPSELGQMRLPPCHTHFQVHAPANLLSVQVYMRSVDLCLGFPFNLASYAMLTHTLAQLTNREPWEVIFNFGNVHIYSAHIRNAFEQIEREPCHLPELVISGELGDLKTLVPGQFRLIGYDHHPEIAYELFP